jgi:protease I
MAQPQLSRAVKLHCISRRAIPARAFLISQHNHIHSINFSRKGIYKMANENLKGKKVAILVTDGFEQVELLQPREALDKAGAETKVVSLKEGPVKGWDMTKWGKEVPADLTLDSAKPNDFDALLLPGGVINPDKLRMEPKAVAFVKSFFDAGKPVAAICHGPWMLVEAGVARGRKIASWPSIKTDIRNAGAEWVDKEAVTDGNLVTARKPDDIPAFNRAMIELFSSGVQHKRPAA